MNAEFNPYAPPKTTELSAPVAHNHDLPLAGRGHRLAASFLDSIISMAFILPVQFFTGTFQREMARQAAEGSVLAFRPENLLWSALGFMFLVAINWKLLAKGQTIGKLVLKIRIDRVEGGPCERGRIILRRMLVLNVIYLIPGINFIFILVDSLMIFRKDKRTLHDMIAGTKVVDVRQAV